MAPLKKSSSSSKTRSSSSSNVSLAKVKGENFYRNAKQVSRLKMLSGGKPIRDKDGKIIQAAAFQKGEDETKPGRVQPDRRWFGTVPIPDWFDICQCSKLRMAYRKYESDLSDSSGSLQDKSF
jgi:nuclear GTP-binding protein